MIDIKVNCKRCGKPAKSTEFVLDPYYKLMVCSTCVKDRQMAEKTKEKETKKTQEQAIETQKIESEKKLRPPGWDSDDVFLEKSYKQKEVVTPKVQEIDAERVKYKCTHCDYLFTYNTIKQTPARCPYCSTDVATKFKY